MKASNLFLAAASVLATTTAAHAGTTFYSGDTGRTQFTTATSGGTMSVEGFEGITTRTTNNIGYQPYGSTFSRNGLTIGGSFGGMSVLDTTYLNGGNQVATRFGSAAGAVFDTNYSDLTFTFASAVNSFGLDLATIARGFSGSSNGAFTLTVNGQTFTYNYSGSSGFGFLGVTSDTAFTSLTITTSKSFDSELNDVRFGTVAATAAVPEPATWGLMILGFGLMGGALRSRKTSIAFA